MDEWNKEFRYLLDWKILSRDEFAYLLGQIKSIINSETTDLQAENKRLKATNQRLNRRTQEAESALIEWQKISEFTKHQSTGRFFPALIRHALTKASEENKKLKNERTMLRGYLASIRWKVEQALKG